MEYPYTRPCEECRKPVTINNKQQQQRRFCRKCRNKHLTNEKMKAYQREYHKKYRQNRQRPKQESVRVDGNTKKNIQFPPGFRLLTSINAGLGDTTRARFNV